MPRTATLWLLPALALLNAALAFRNVWPTPWIAPGPGLSVEAAAAALALCAAAGRRGAVPRRALTALAGLLTLLVVVRYLEVTSPALYGRRIDLYWDAEHLPRVAMMIVEAAPAWAGAAAVAGLASLLALVFLALRAALGAIARAVAAPGPRRAVAAACAAVLLAFAAGLAGAGTAGWFSRPVLLALTDQAALSLASLRGERGPGADPASKAPALPASRLDRVRGADVALVFIESYGAVTFDRPAVADRVAPHRAALARAAEASGRDMVSALVTSPTFGGASWLAHSSLLSGAPITHAGAYARLLAGRRETLVTRFAAAGWRTVALMPGLKRAWPEGAFYGFDRIVDEAALDYRGPTFGWWRVPDQFSLAWLSASELGPRERAPVFAVFATVASHMPFRPTPPYQPDWDALAGDAPFTGTDLAASAAGTPDWLDLAPAYADAVGYGLTALAGWLQRPRERDLVLVVLGDHQPAAMVSGVGARRDVPVHVITGRRDVLDSLREAGFRDGLSPDRRALMPLHALAGVLLAAFESAPAPPAIGARGPAARRRAGSAGRSPPPQRRFHAARARDRHDGPARPHAP